MERIILLFGLFVVFAYSDTTTTYRWPIPSGQGGDTIISNFGDYRPQSGYASAHFHEGLDIKADSTGGRRFDVISVTYGFKLRTLPDLASYGWIVKVRHYFDDASGAWNHGSNYIHMWNRNDSLNDTSIVYQGVYISHQTTFWRNHLHLEYTSLSWDGSFIASRNPFLLSELPIPLTDSRKPILNHLYVDYSCHGNAEVENLNFLGYEFDTLYRDTTYQGITFKKLKLPTETPDNDLDDPHILISDNRKVRFVLGGHDNFFSTTDRGAPYELSLFLFDADSTGVRQKSYYTVRFDSLLGSTDEVYQEEDVYHVSAPLVSGIDAPQYYRLYPCDSARNGLPGCVVTGRTELKTEDLDEGMHRIRVYAKDYQNNTKTADVHFYIRKSNWVDFCRGFRE